MKKVAILFICMVSLMNGYGSDLIVTKKGKKIRGTVTEISQKGNFAIRTDEGPIVVIAKKDISKIYRPDKTILDFEEGTRYILEKKHPFLPFVVLGLASGGYGISKYQDYRDNKERARKELEELDEGSDYTNLNDQSKKDLAWCVVSGLFSVGSFAMAFKPLEFKIYKGRINISATTTRQGFLVALYF